MITELFLVALCVLTFLGYGIFGVLLVMHSPRQPLSQLMALAALCTSVWAAVALAGRYDIAPPWSLSLTDALRDGAWFAVILASIDRPAQSSWRILVAVSAIVLLLNAVLQTTGVSFGSLVGVKLDATFSGLVTAILGLVLIENLARNSSQDKFWAIKYLVIAMVTILTFEFFVRIAEFLRQQPGIILTIAAPFIYLLVLPLFAVTAIRSPTAQLQVHSSRRVIFHTATLVIAGIALQGTALAAYYLRNYGGDTGTVLAIIFVFAGIVGVLSVASSNTVRSRLRIFINENFFNYKYDYRAEWTKFIHALSTLEEHGTPLKVLRTFTELMDSPGGALWIWKDNFRQFLPMAKWSVRADLKPISPDDPILAAFADEACTSIDLTSPEQAGLAAPWNAQYPDQWMVVPLRYRSQLVAILLICRPRTRRTLDWEDRNLISLVALQLAVYLVHDETSQALLDAKQMEEFNKRFAFLIHDMKNTIGQLDLLARNAERFIENLDFQKDMKITLRNSVEKLNSLLAQIRGGGADGDNMANAGNKNVDVVELVKTFIGDKRNLGLPVVMRDQVSPARATVTDDITLTNILEHVVANAVEVSPADADVKVQLSVQRGMIRIAVDDEGPGMSQEFISERLFRPFRTTKQHGFGIGAYQSRENVRKLGGDFEVFSVEGHGTSIVISVPCTLVQNPSVN